MLSAEELNQISQVMSEQLKPVIERLDRVEDRLDRVENMLDEIIEDTEITRVATNELVKWVEVNFSYKYPFPIEDEERVK